MLIIDVRALTIATYNDRFLRFFLQWGMIQETIHCNLVSVKTQIGYGL